MAIENAASATAQQPEVKIARSFEDLAEILAARQASQATPAEPKPDPSKESGEGEAEQVPSEEGASEDSEGATNESDEQAQGTEEEGDQESEGEGDAGAQGNPEWVKGRLSKLSAQKREWKQKAEEAASKLQELESKLAAVESQPAQEAPRVATPADPLGFIASPAKLDSFKATVERQAELIDDYLDGVKLTEADRQAVEGLAKQTGAVGEDGEIDHGLLKRQRREADKLLNRIIPQKQQWFAEEANLNAATEKEYAWWKDRSSEEYRLANQAMQILPEVKRFPGWKRLISYWTVGALADMRAKAAQSKAQPTAAKPKPKQLPTKLPASTGNPSPKSAPKPDVAKAALASLAQTNGSVDDLAQYLAARRQQ